MSDNDPKLANRQVAKIALMCSVGAFAFAFSLIPMYQVLCEITGINYTDFRTSIANAATMQSDEERWVTVQFDGTVNSGLPWQFKPGQRHMQVKLGELYETLYVATNTSRRSVVGQAVPSVAPTAAALYFNKTECFCFTEQMLEAGESRDMPVRFIVDPNLPRNLDEVTLSYVFFANDSATERLTLATSPHD